MNNLTFEFLSILNGNDLTAKRNVLSKYGSNLIWDEEKLDIINQKPFQVLIDGLSLAKQKNPKFEPDNIEDTSDENEVFRDVCPIMRNTWDNVRNILEVEHPEQQTKIINIANNYRLAA